MDAIAYTRRLVKGSELTYAEGDANLDATQTALEQLDSEKVSIEDAVDVETGTGDVLLTDVALVFRADVPLEYTVAKLLEPATVRLDAIDVLLEDLEAAIEAIL